VLVEDNQPVKKGQLLIVLNDDSQKAALAQAQANLDLAIAQANGAGISVGLTGQTATPKFNKRSALSDKTRLRSPQLSPT